MPASKDTLSYSSSEETNQSCPLWQLLLLLALSLGGVIVIVLVIVCCCHRKSAGPTLTVYHATAKTNIQGILSDGFQLPTEGSGLKLGLAVYFGKDQASTVEDAVTLAMAAQSCQRGQQCEKDIREGMGLVEAVVNVSK